MEFKNLTKKQAIELLERIDRWNYTYDDNLLGDARFRIKVNDIFEVEEPQNV
ncbi:hypothetical protein LCGC14_1253260 [marine sediment metagenome]|uniref:Uncharacterized protein n=1 Tax=marine sediment metagenome TaxID=412755 RepID=A0A0F9P6C9_9ZZZZ